MDRYRRVFTMMLEIIINDFSSTPNVILVIQKKKKRFSLERLRYHSVQSASGEEKKRLRSLHLKVGKLCVKIMKIIMPSVKNLKTKNRILYSWTETRCRRARESD